MRTVICVGELAHGSRPSYRNHIGGLGLQSDYQTNDFSDFLQNLSSDSDGQTHPECSKTQTFFPLLQLSFILFWTEQAGISQIMF